MNPNSLENEADSGSSSASESLSVVTDESSTASSSSQEDEDISNNKGMDMMKKVKKLRSMKLAKFPSLKLITRRMRIQPDYSSLFSSDAASSEQSTPLKMLHLSPNYMKTTNSSNAKKGTSQKSTRTLIRRSSFKPGRSLTRLSSTKYRNPLTRRSSEGTDLKKKAKKSRPTKLVNQRSTVSGVADTPKILKPTNGRIAQASRRDSMTSLSSNVNNRKGSNTLMNSLASSGNKSMRVKARTSTLRPARILIKMASLRTKRSSMKRSSEILDTGVHKATCSSALKEYKFPGNLEVQLGESESGGISAMKVCPYSYCSLHGHHHSSDLPPLKRFVSMRRRQLKSQKSTRSQSWSLGPKNSGNTKGNRTNQFGDTGDAFVLETAHESHLVVSVSEPTEEHSPTHEEPNESAADDHDSNTADSGAEFCNVTSPMKKQEHMGLWRFIYKHMASGIAAIEEDSLRTHDEVDKNEVEDGNISDQSMHFEDQERESMNSQLNQYNAIKLVKEAFDKILSEIPDQSSDDNSMNNGTSEDKDVPEDNPGEGEVLSTTSFNSGEDNAAENQQEMRHNTNDINAMEGEKAKPKTEGKSNQQTPKGWSNIKKVIILRRFFKSLQKVRNFIPPKAKYVPMSGGPEAEMINLRHQQMLGRKASEEWMLDYALQQVISTLAPAQKRKVALLVQAFETVAPLPEMSNLSYNLEAPRQATPDQNFADLQGQNENGNQINFSVLRETPCCDLNILKDQDSKESVFYKVEYNPASFSDNSRAISGSNFATVDTLTTKNAAGDKREEVSTRSNKDSKKKSIKDVQAESTDSDSMETERKLCYEASPKSADVQLPSSEEVSANRKVIEDVVGEIMPASEDHDCGLSGHNKEPRHLISSHTDQSDEMNSQNLSNADAHASASDSILQGRSSEETVGEITIKDKILQRFSDLLEESKSTKTTGEKLEKQLHKEKNMRLWFTIYKHMASGNTIPLEEAAEDGPENDAGTMIGMSDAPSQGATAVNDDPVDQKIKLQQIEAIRLVEEAIDGIQLPENQDESDASDMTPDTKHLEEKLVQGRESLESTPAGSIKEKDRTMLDGKEPSLGSSSVIISEEKAESLKKTGNENNPSMKNWSNLKKMILLRRFVKALEKVKIFTPRGPRFLPVDPDKEAEKVNLRHQDLDDRKNADEWMLDYALQQVVAKLTPARKRKVELLVEAFETVIPTVEN